MQAELHATITIKPTAPPELRWDNNYVVPNEVRVKTAIKELEKVIKEISNENIKYRD